MLKTAPLPPNQVVTRIQRTQQSMKTFLGTLNRPSPPPLAATSLLQIHSPDAPPQPPAVDPCQAQHCSFQRQVRDINTWVPCAMCSTSQCSTTLHYLHLPSMPKPWIPLCSKCAARKM